MTENRYIGTDSFQYFNYILTVSYHHPSQVYGVCPYSTAHRPTYMRLSNWHCVTWLQTLCTEPALPWFLGIGHALIWGKRKNFVKVSFLAIIFLNQAPTSFLFQKQDIFQRHWWSYWVLNFPGCKKHVPESEELTFIQQMPSPQRYSLIQVDLISLHTRLISSFVWVPSVDGELLDAGSCGCSRLGPSAGLALTKFTRRKEVLQMQDKFS